MRVRPGWAKRPFSRREVQLLTLRATHTPATACINLGLATPQSSSTVEEAENLTRGRVGMAPA